MFNRHQDFCFQVDVHSDAPCLNYFGSTPQKGGEQITCDMQLIRTNLSPSELGAKRGRRKMSESQVCYLLLIRDISRLLVAESMVDNEIGQYLVKIHGYVLHKCLRHLNFIEEEAFKSENQLSVFTKKEMLTFTQKPNQARLNQRHYEHSNPEEANKIHSDRILNQLQKSQVKLWSSARHLKMNILAYNNLMKSKVPDMLTLKLIPPKNKIKSVLNKAIVPLAYQISLKRLKIDIQVAEEVE